MMRPLRAGRPLPSAPPDGPSCAGAQVVPHPGAGLPARGGSAVVPHPGAGLPARGGSAVAPHPGAGLPARGCTAVVPQPLPGVEPAPRRSCGAVPSVMPGDSHPDGPWPVPRPAGKTSHWFAALPWPSVAPGLPAASGPGCGSPFCSAGCGTARLFCWSMLCSSEQEPAGSLCCCPLSLGRIPVRGLCCGAILPVTDNPTPGRRPSPAARAWAGFQDAAHSGG
jgi:hypothetical protein